MYCATRRKEMLCLKCAKSLRIEGLPRARKLRAQRRPLQAGGKGPPQGTAPRAPTHSWHQGSPPRTRICAAAGATWINRPNNERRQLAGRTAPFPPTTIRPRMQNKTAATRTKWRIAIACNLHWLRRVMAGQARQVTLPGREIVVGPEAFIPFVTRRASSCPYMSRPYSPSITAPEKAAQRQACAGTRTTATPGATPPPPPPYRSLSQVKRETIEKSLNMLQT
jgi:hypothetical protein